MPKCAVDLENLTQNWENKYYVKKCRSPWFFVRPVFSSFSGGSFSHFDRVLNYKIWFSSSFTHVSPNASRLSCCHKKKVGPVVTSGWWVGRVNVIGWWSVFPSSKVPTFVNRQISYRRHDWGRWGEIRWGGRGGEMEPKNRVKVFFSLGT